MFKNFFLFQLNESALSVEKEVRTKIIQAVEKEPGKFGNYALLMNIFNFIFIMNISLKLF